METDTALAQILAQLEKLQTQQQAMQAKLDQLPTEKPLSIRHTPSQSSESLPQISTSVSPPSNSVLSSLKKEKPAGSAPKPDSKEREKTLYPGRVLLTTYPDQHSHTPFPLQWLATSPNERGPVICSRLPGSIKRRNAIGAHSGSYSIYRALSIAMGSLDPAHKPDFTMTEPPIEIPPNSTWGTDKIVAFDPWGHLTTTVFRKESDEGLDIRPSIAITKAHLKLSEVDDTVRKGQLSVDGKIVLPSAPLRNEDGSEQIGVFSGVEMAVSKAAIEPVWYLPGVAERFGISEQLLRRALFEDTGGMYPELITRPDIKVFLPPIGGLTVYIFGNTSYLSDETKELTLRVHDECNGSDVFGSDICTCKPYLVYAIEECVRCAQRGGVGVVVYFRKEGRALGEVTKYLVYNLRKRGGDSADRYFKSTEMVAGVKDMRFQALMPDVLHWLGIKKIDKMVSMSDMKYNAIVNSGISILHRYDLPDHLIPPDSRVEIDAKIASGYFSSGKQVTEADLKQTVGRAWEEVEH